MSARILIKQNGDKCEVWEEGESQLVRPDGTLEPATPYKVLKFSGGRVAAKQVAIDGNRRRGYPVFNVKQGGKEVPVRCPDWDRWDPYNLPQKIVRYVRTLWHLEPLATGGGCDFVTRTWEAEDGRQWCQAVLSSKLDCSSTPDELNEPSMVTFYPNQDWMQSFTVSFPTASEALRFMVSDIRPEWCNVPDQEEADQEEVQS